MPPFRKPNLVTLRRQLPNQAWGFRLGGGAEIGQPFQIQKVTPGSLAFLGGLSEGDELVRIGNISLRGLTHDEVQQIVLRCSHCIDLFVFRNDGGDVTPRFELVSRPELFSRHEQFPRFQSAPASPTVKSQPPVFGNSMPHPDINQIPTTQALGSPGVDMRQDFNRSPRPFDANVSPVFGQAVSPTQAGYVQQQPQLAMPMVDTKPGSPVRDPRVFGMSRGSKSPNRPNVSLSRENSNPNSPIPPALPMTQSSMPMVNNANSQSIPTTPAATKNFAFFDNNDLNNNPMNGGDKKIFGLPSRGGSKMISPLGNHGVQPVNNEQRRVFGMNPRQRYNSFSCDHDWKTALPIVNIPNTDQLLPSQTKQMQTYINQTPPTEKNLRPSLIGLERRRIRPVWPPPHPGRLHKVGFQVEGRDSPSSKMMNWPPRAQSVDRDFSYGEGVRGQTPERCMSPFSSSRVQVATKIWPPPSNATPAGASGFIGDEGDNYAYNPAGQVLPGVVSSHIPPTYRPPPGALHLMVNDF